MVAQTLEEAAGARGVLLTKVAENAEYVIEIGIMVAMAMGWTEYQ